MQSGSPEEVYQHPATPLVARFTGLAGELAVTVAGQAGDGMLELAVPGAGDGVRLPALRPAGPGAPPPHAADAKAFARHVRKTRLRRLLTR